MNKELEATVRFKRKKIRTVLVNWGRKHIRQFPWRINRTPYKVLIAEAVLRRTTATAAVRAYEQIINNYPDIYSLDNADLMDLEEILKTVGYHKQRAKILKNFARCIVSKHGGIIPSSESELLSIPHIGHYTAGAIRSLGYGIPSVMVDSNVIRIITRIFSKSFIRKPTLITIQEIEEQIVPKTGHENFNLLMLDFGALVCRYIKPRCQDCPIKIICDTGNIS